MNAVSFFDNKQCDMQFLPWPFLTSRRQRLLKRALSVLRYALSGMLLSTLSARAEAPAPSQAFWNYFVEFGDVQGELFDPSDYAAVANLPAKALKDIDAADAQKSINAQRDDGAAQEQAR